MIDFSNSIIERDRLETSIKIDCTDGHADSIRLYELIKELYFKMVTSPRIEIPLR